MARGNATLLPSVVHLEMCCKRINALSSEYHGTLEIVTTEKNASLNQPYASLITREPHRIHYCRYMLTLVSCVDATSKRIQRKRLAAHHHIGGRGGTYHLCGAECAVPLLNRLTNIK